MHRDATKNPGRTLATWACCLITGACSGTVLDPEAILAEAPPRTASSTVLHPATGGVHPLAQPATPPAAPVAEVARPASPRSTVIAVGRRAQPSLGEQAQRAFGQSLEGGRCERIDSSDRGAIELLKVGDADFALIGGQLSPLDLRGGLRQTQVGVELFGVVIAGQPGLESLTSQQVRGIFTGALSDWSQLGRGAGPITAIVPADPRTQERAAGVLITGDRFASSCRRAAGEPALADMLDEEPGALAVVRLTAARRASGQRVLDINWTSPSLEAFRYGTYPFGVPVQLITTGEGAAAAAPFLRFARTAAGREHLGRHLMLSR